MPLQPRAKRAEIQIANALSVHLLSLDYPNEDHRFEIMPRTKAGVDVNISY